MHSFGVGTKNKSHKLLPHSHALVSQVYPQFKGRIQPFSGLFSILQNTFI